MHQPKKRFGQNFLIDDFIIARIIDAIDPKPSMNIAEIGPGLGALTLPLLARAPLSVVEIDRDLVAHWQSQNLPNLTVIPKDALTADFSPFDCVVGNLPYNISTPILFYLLGFGNIQQMYFMLQKEVVDRMSASPNQKSYGRLSVMVQYRADVKKLFEVPTDAFDPAPKVVSAVCCISPNANKPRARDERVFDNVVRLLFNHRRKTLRAILKNSPYAFGDDAPVDLSLRPENLAVDDFIALSDYLGG